MQANELIAEAYELAQLEGYNQTRWSADSGFAVNGQTVSRILKKGDCRVSTFVTLLNTIGYRLKIEQIE